MSELFVHWDCTLKAVEQRVMELERRRSARESEKKVAEVDDTMQ